MRSQYAVLKFDRKTGDILWILAATSTSSAGWIPSGTRPGTFIGQHYAQYVPVEIAGNDSTVTVFDNHTNYSSNTTRVFIFTLDEAGKTATAKVINGSDLDKLSEKRHWSTHCASVEMQTKDSCFIGWGSNAMLNMNVKTT